MQHTRFGAELFEELVTVLVAELRRDLETLERNRLVEAQVRAAVDDAEAALTHDLIDRHAAVDHVADPAERIDLAHEAHITAPRRRMHRVARVLVLTLALASERPDRAQEVAAEDFGDARVAPAAVEHHLHHPR